MAARVEQAQRAITRSEADVRSLERRQRRLANEKAQVEDARAQLALERDAIAEEADVLGNVAAAFVTCKNGLVELLNYVLADNDGAAAAIVGRVDGDCEVAEGELSSYIAAYGN